MTLKTNSPTRCAYTLLPWTSLWDPSPCLPPPTVYTYMIALLLHQDSQPPPAAAANAQPQPAITMCPAASDASCCAPTAGPAASKTAYPAATLSLCCMIPPCVHSVSCSLWHASSPHHHVAPSLIPHPRAHCHNIFVTGAFKRRRHSLLPQRFSSNRHFPQHVVCSIA